MWVSTRFHLLIFVYGVNQENKGAGRVLDSGQFGKLLRKPYLELSAKVYGAP